MKELSKYTVNVRKSDLQKLLSVGAIEKICEAILFVRDPIFYDGLIGLKTENNWLDEPLIV